MLRQVPIRRGELGTFDTLGLINVVGTHGASLPYVQRFVLTVPLREWNHTLARHWHYASENEETIRSIAFQISSLMKHGKLIGDCDDAAAVVVACAVASRLPYRIVAVRFPEVTEFGHVFVEVVKPGTYAGVQDWLRIDPTAPGDADYTFCERMEFIP